MKNIFGTLIKSTTVHVTFAFVAMGSWAIYANAGHPMPKPIIAGLVQGTISAGLTMFLKQSVDWMRPKFPRAVGYVAPALISSLASAALLITAHNLAGTPEIATTIAVPLTVSVFYIITYNITRQHAARHIAHE